MRQFSVFILCHFAALQSADPMVCSGWVYYALITTFAQITVTLSKSWINVWLICMNWLNLYWKCSWTLNFFTALSRKCGHVDSETAKCLDTELVETSYLTSWIPLSPYDVDNSLLNRWANYSNHFVTSRFPAR